MHYILFYDLVENALEARAPYRDDHLALASDAFERGFLTMAGALTDPADTSILIFRADSKAEVEEFARNDPYVNNGVVTKWSVREWAVAIPKG